MKVRRDIGSIPLRSSSETWKKIVELVTGDGSVDTEQLQSVTGIVASIIADENLSKYPITFKGVGDRLVIYCSYGPDAMEMGMGIDSILWNPTAGDWRMYLPCDDKNIEWVQEALQSEAPNIIAHEFDSLPHDDDEGDESKLETAFQINWEAIENI